jgi:aspartoacylase
LEICLNKINNLSLVGGTHGNEVTGIALVNYFLAQGKSELTQYDFNIDCIIANKEAQLQNKRYLDNDLNRCFRKDLLADKSLSSHEDLLAKDLNQLLGPKGDAKTDFIIDLHTTTSNMQVSILLLRQDKFHKQLCAYLKQSLNHTVNIHCVDEVEGDHPYLCTIANKGIIIEVGPTPQGLLRSDVYQMTKDAVLAAFDFVEHYNQQTLPALPDEINAFRYMHSLTLPADSQGNVLGMVHEHIQDKDYQPLKPGEPLFRLFNGEELLYEGEQTVYPAFINEAAYYDQSLAVSLMEPVVVSGVNQGEG